MKIPIEWLKQYIHTNKTSKELSESFTNLGLMLDKPIFTYENGKYSTDMLDLEHRMDRSDWLAILGCARDLAAYEDIELKFPDLHDKAPAKLDAAQKIKIDVQYPQVVNRFNTRIFKNITVKPSPDWLKNRLEAYGIPSINNIVDITNYVMVELGQPMHAQDISKLEKPEIVIRMARNGEKITTLLGETLSLDENTFVLTQNDKPTVIGGIVGGAETGITNATTEIVLDAGNYNQTNVRKTSRRLKIQNETVLRYDKFLHPELTEIAIQRATKLILELAGGEYYENVDWYPTKWKPKKLNLSFARLQQLGGALSISQDFVENVLEKLEYKVLHKTDAVYEVEIPYFRTDVEVEDDIVADILRIYGYPKIPLQQIDQAPPTDITPKIYKFEDVLRDACLMLGLHEHITDPLVKADDQNNFQVKLENSQSQLKNALRTNIYDGLKTVAENYSKHKISPIGLFEVGKIYARENKSKELKDFSEIRITQVLYINKELSLNENSIQIRKLLDGVFAQLGIGEYSLKKTTDQVHHGVEIIVGGENCGFLGWDHFVLKNEKIMKYYVKRDFVTTEFEELFSDDISMLVPEKVGLGDIVEETSKLVEAGSTVEIALQNYDGVSQGFKPALLTISHKTGNFSATRKTIVEKLKSEFGVTIK